MAAEGNGVDPLDPTYARLERGSLDRVVLKNP
jgi:hypothetical protein